MYSKSKVLVVTVTHTTLYAFASDGVSSFKSSVASFDISRLALSLPFELLQREYFT